MRIVKNAEERKMEILDTAEHLFETQGFDNTSTNDILNEIGIARGTLYYHFKSKEEILDAIISRLTRQLLEKAKKAYLGDYDDKWGGMETEIIELVNYLKRSIESSLNI